MFCLRLRLVHVRVFLNFRLTFWWFLSYLSFRFRARDESVPIWRICVGWFRCVCAFCIYHKSKFGWFTFVCHHICIRFPICFAYWVWEMMGSKHWMLSSISKHSTISSVMAHTHTPNIHAQHRHTHPHRNWRTKAFKWWYLFCT